MSIISLLIILVLIGLGLWLVTTLIPMDAKIKTILSAVVVVLVLLWLLEVFGVYTGTVGHIRVH